MAELRQLDLMRFDGIHARRWRAAMEPCDQRIARRSLTDDQHLHASVGEILCISIDAELTRLRTRRRTKEHALHASGDETASRDEGHES